MSKIICLSTFMHWEQTALLRQKKNKNKACWSNAKKFLSDVRTLPHAFRLQKVFTDMLSISSSPPKHAKLRSVTQATTMQLRKYLAMRYPAMQSIMSDAATNSFAHNCCAITNQHYKRQTLFPNAQLKLTFKKKRKQRYCCFIMHIYQIKINSHHLM